MLWRKTLRVKVKNKSWYVYILKCIDGTFYTGITNDIKKRIETHNKGKGAKYTRGRVPVEIVYKKRCKDKSGASKKEARIKQSGKAVKLEIINKYKQKEGQSNKGPSLLKK
ncbi:MAG: hypothetical protein A2452_03005 [Candidatus Firestonebacteria bacterium RIFOXYC2_FULL_39_67]|nr:MAG: hypothetical protein A2536_02420 [Candidatus Firestonebacteria bacterium RIFOXYD2_FULL_39_29]OGF51980.1 MAG: hypothetical protein A2497_09000 [Candidatus Firestonebacteria bacterium RifOxyC12_full_39_7]OGF55422.1 MAG: hypothetical protein A2452_03005 [Candidatus Firestonebacteria bacterium RIFOXYC2_FULL_39_67]